MTGVFDQLTVYYIFSVVLVVLVGWIVRLEIKLNRLLLGKDAKSLEDSISSTKDGILKLQTFQNTAEKKFGVIEKKLSRSIQAVETIRFNPFKGTGDGGNQSFSTSFISEDGDGAVISSMYSRDHVSVFSKPIAKFESSFELTEEERGVIENSKRSLAQ